MWVATVGAMIGDEKENETVSMTERHGEAKLLELEINAGVVMGKQTVMANLQCDSALLAPKHERILTSNGNNQPMAGQTS